MASGVNHWEDLRKQARQLENEIDLKLVSFSKLGTNYSHKQYKDDGSDTSPLLSSTGSDHMFETMAMEIEQLLTKLSEVNSDLSEYASSLSVSSPTAAMMHTLQRHHDILQDYGHEFTKTRANITAFRQREDLLGSVRQEIDSYKTNMGLNRRTDLYLKENEHIRSSERLTDEAIGVAMATKENLAGQRSSLKKISSGVSSMANRFPVINSLVQRINLRKRRDSIIIASVIAICLIFILIWEFH